MQQTTEYALSLKQPWAALVVHGLKTVEVRSWQTARRGRVLIHAAAVSDDRPEAWALVPEEMRATAERTRGIVGAAELIQCLAYHTPESFAEDRGRHLNDPAWFNGPVLYGFAFTAAVVLPFRSYPGWMRFFPVRAERPRRGREKTMES
jgi:hypothetical protein